MADLGVGCSKAPSPQEQCVLNMQILEDTLRSYRLTHGISDSQSVDPADFTAEYLPEEKRKKLLVCPVSRKPYAPFSHSIGARCPSRLEHTEGLNKARRAEPDGAANGNQPFRSETNPTPSAAGTRR